MNKPTSVAAESHRIPTIGIVGGIASGKSHIARQLEQLGCFRIDADRIGHQVLELPVVTKKLQSLFGIAILNDKGEVDRQELAKLVFGDDESALANMSRLEDVVHPLIRDRVLQQIASVKTQANPPRAVIVDAPLLLEAGWDNLCDYIFFVDTADDVRRSRAAERGWSAEQWRDREAAQLDLSAKRRAASHFIAGDLDPERMRLRLNALLDQMRD